MNVPPLAFMERRVFKLESNQERLVGTEKSWLRLSGAMGYEKKGSSTSGKTCSDRM